MKKETEALEVLSNERLAEDVFALSFRAPYIAEAARAGQFVMIMACEKSERIPLTIADRDKETGSVTLVFKVMGRSSSDLSFMKKGDSLFYA
ncbi:MAG: ferredoxin-NADP reductase, partial [Elusimicrobia bacterium CG_4_8_14_3_um_filter_50_9]